MGQAHCPLLVHKLPLILKGGTGFLYSNPCSRTRVYQPFPHDWYCTHDVKIPLVSILDETILRSHVHFESCRMRSTTSGDHRNVSCILRESRTIAPLKLGTYFDHYHRVLHNNHVRRIKCFNPMTK